MDVVNFADLTLNFRTGAMFVSAIVYVMYSYVSALSVSKFQMPVSNGSLAIALKPKTEGQLC
jgi:multisubunit Na+/H+ antiporter MnhF subunit